MNDSDLRDSAWRFILRENIHALPVNVWALVRKKGYRLYTYDEYAEIIQDTKEHVVQTYDKDGFVFWSAKLSTYIIVYNADMLSATARWTIMHEIAHIELGHVSAPMTRVRRISHPQWERDADGFARRVLCPSVVLHCCNAYSVGEIMQLCGVSRSCAEYRYQHMLGLRERNAFLLSPLERDVKQAFNRFITRYILDKMRTECARLAV